MAPLWGQCNYIFKLKEEVFQMTAFSFDSIVGQSIAFDVNADVLSLAYSAEDITLTQLGTNLLVTVASVGSVTLTGVDLAEIASTNLSIAGGSVIVGDDTTGTTGDAANQNLTGTASGDVIYGMGGNDTIDGDEGNDVIFGGDSITDTLDGADVITTGTGTNTVYANSGDDTINGGATAAGESALIYAGRGDDDVNIGALVGDNVIFGNFGDDDIDFDAATDTASVTVYGGNAETDTLDGADTIRSHDGDASIWSNSGDDNIIVGNIASGKTQYIDAGIGDDSVVDLAPGGALADATGFDGDAVIIGNRGADSIFVDGTNSTSNVTVYGGNAVEDSIDGADLIRVGQGSAVVYGNGDADDIILEGSSGTTQFANGGRGNDTIRDLGDNVTNLGGGTYFIQGGWDDDEIDLDSIGDVTDVTIYGGNKLTDTLDGDDTISVEASGIAIENGELLETVAIYGNSGDDDITFNSDGIAAGGLDATINGGIGNDVIDVELTDGDTGIINIGAGDDTLTMTTMAGEDAEFFVQGYSTDDTVTIDLNGATAAEIAVSTTAAGTLLEDGIDGSVNLDGYTGNLNLALGAGSVLITNTTDTPATLTGGAGDDQLVSGDAADTLVAGGGDDVLIGGAADDTFQFADQTEFDGNDTITGGDDVDTIEFTGATDLTGIAFTNVSEVEAISATAGAFEIDAAATNGTDIVTIDASGAASLTVNPGVTDADLTVTGSAGADSIDFTGATGDLTIDGGAGADTITGGDGVDNITTGAGADVLLYGDPTQTNSGSIDVITDFDADSDSFDFTTTAGTGNAVNFVNGEAGDFSAATTINSAATLFVASDVAMQAADAAGTFTYGGNTYLVVNDAADATYDAADDYLVDITGYVGTITVTDIVTQ